MAHRFQGRIQQFLKGGGQEAGVKPPNPLDPSLILNSKVVSNIRPMEIQAA